MALSMAVNSNVLANSLGGGRLAMYSYVTRSIEHGKFAGLKHDWESKNISNLNIPGIGLYGERLGVSAQELFADAGYSKNNSLKLEILTNHSDSNITIANDVITMWKDAFGADKVQVTIKSVTWDEFLKERKSGKFQIIRDSWISDYNSVDSYANNFLCGAPNNISGYCNPKYDQLIYQARASKSREERVILIRQAVRLAMDDYPVIPLFQSSYNRLVKPYVHGYNPTDNHLDRVMSKWFHY